MTIETIQKRIEGKQKAIESLLKKIDRIEKAKATNWKKNPYWYSEHDLEVANRDLAAEQKALQGYKDQLIAETEKANSRNVKALVDFLEAWKAGTIKWFKEEKVRYDAALKEYYAEDRAYVDKYNNRRALELTSEELKELDKKHRALRSEFQRNWLHVTQFNHGSLSWEATMEKDIEIEKNRKYDDIIERTNAIVGKITDASGLRVGRKQDLNGIIIGERGKAKVETIGAGGYAIQRFHFRTLITRI